MDKEVEVPNKCLGGIVGYQPVNILIPEYHSSCGCHSISTELPQGSLMHG